MKPSSQTAGPAKLFIKSLRVPIVRYEMPNMSQGGHYCSAGYRAQSTTISLSPEEDRAKKILTRSGMKFEIVDLSERGERKLLAGWLHGVKHTPTLLVEGHPRRRIEGVEAISNYLNTLRKIGQDSTKEENVAS